MADYQLYCFAQSGNSYKAALMLALAGARWTPVFVDFFNGETRTPEYRRNVNEMGEVPVLVEGTRKLSQSGAILTHLAQRSGRFGGKDGEARLEILRWILFDNHKFTSYLATYRFLHAFAKSGEPAVMEFLRGRIAGALGIVSKHLSTQSFIAGPEPSIADLSLCGYLFYPAEEFGFDIAAEHPEIGEWLARIRALPGWVHPRAPPDREAAGRMEPSAMRDRCSRTSRVSLRSPAVHPGYDSLVLPCELMPGAARS